MKKLLSVAAVSGLVISGIVFAAGMGQPGGQPPAGGGGQPPARGLGGGGGGGQPGERGGRGQGGQGLQGSMKAMDRALEALKGSISDASKKEENLRLLGEAERGAVNAKNARPTEAINEAKDEAAKAAVAAEYRKELLNVLKALIEAEEATMNGKTAEAKAALDKVAALRDHGHKEFNVGEDKKGGAPAGGGREGK